MVAVKERSATVSAGKSIVCLFNSSREGNLLTNREYADEIANLFDNFFRQIELSWEVITDASVLKLGSYCCDKVAFEIAKSNATKTDCLAAQLYRLSFVIPKLNLLFGQITSIKSIMFWSSLMARKTEVCMTASCAKSEFLDFCYKLLDSEWKFQEHGPFIETMLCCVCIVLKSAGLCCSQVLDSHPVLDKLNSKLLLGNFVFYGKSLTLNPDEICCLEKLTKRENIWFESSVSDLELFTLMNHFKNYIRNKLMRQRNDLSKDQFYVIVDFVSGFCHLISVNSVKNEELTRVCRNFAIDCYNVTITRLQADLDFLIQIAQSEDEKFIDGKMERLKNALTLTNSSDENFGAKLTANLARFAMSQLKALASTTSESRKYFDANKLKGMYRQLSRVVFEDRETKLSELDKDACLNEVRTISSVAYWASKCGLISCSDDCQLYRTQFVNLLTRRTPLNLLIENDELLKEYLKCWQALQRYTDFKLSFINGSDDPRVDIITDSSTAENRNRSEELKTFLFNSIRNSIDLISGSRTTQFLCDARPVTDIHALVDLEVLTVCQGTQVWTRVFNIQLSSVVSGDDVKRIQNVCSLVSMRNTCESKLCSCCIRLTCMQLIVGFLVDTFDNHDANQKSLKCPFADHLENIISVLTSSSQIKRLRETFDVELATMFIHAASVLEFYGLKLQALFIWTFLSSQAYLVLKRDGCNSNNAEKWSIICAISVFYGFNTAFSCGSLSICMKLEQRLLRTIGLLTENEQESFKNFFGKEFLRLKLDACMKRRELVDIIHNVLTLIDTDSLKPWSVFSSAVAIDFLVDLLSESEVSSTDLSNINESVKSDESQPTKPFYAFFAKWKVEVFRYWKSMCRKSVNFSPEVDTYKPILPLFLNVQLKQPLCGLLVAPFAYENYAQLGHMIKSVGLVDVSKSYDSFISEGNYVGQSHSRILKQIFEAKSFIESAYSYAYVHLFDRCYECLVKCANCYLEPQDQVKFEARDRLDSSTEVSDSKKIQAQQGLIDNVPQIPLTKLVNHFKDHKVECLCADYCGHLSKFDNIALLVSLLYTLPGSHYGEKGSKIELFNQGKLLEILNSKLKYHGNKIEALMPQLDGVSDVTSRNVKEVAKSSGKGGSKNRTRSIPTSNEPQKNDSSVSLLQGNFVSRYHFTGTVPSIRKFTRINFVSTLFAAQATLEGLSQQTKLKVPIETTGSSDSSEIIRNCEEQNLIDALENLAVDVRKDSVESCSLKEPKIASTSNRGAKKLKENKVTARKAQKDSGESKKIPNFQNQTRATVENRKQPARSTEFVAAKNNGPRSKKKGSDSSSKTGKDCKVNQANIASGEPVKSVTLSNKENCVTRVQNANSHYCSRLISSEIEICSPLESWIDELQNVIMRSRNFRLIRQMKSAGVLQSIANNSGDSMESSGVNPTAFNVCLFFTTETDQKHIEYLRRIFSLPDIISDQRLLTKQHRMIPENWAIVHIVENGANYDSVSVSINARNHDCTQIGFDQLKYLICEFIAGLKENKNVDPSANRKAYWAKRFEAEQNLKHLITKMNKELEPLKKAMEKKFSNVENLVLIVESQFNSVPWERLDCFTMKSVGRYPSEEFFFHHLKSVSFPDSRAIKTPMKMQSFYYLVNPSGDLQSTQLTFEGFFRDLNVKMQNSELKSMEKSLKVEGLMGTEPSIEQMQTLLETCDVYLYCGHGAGSKFYPSSVLRGKKPKLNCVALLIGCGSGSLNSLSDNLDPTNIPFDFLLTGAPAVVANLWDVSDKEIDAFTVALLKRIFKLNTADDNKQIDFDEAKENISGFENVSKSVTLSMTLKQLKRAVKLPVCTGYAPVVYGLPNLTI